MGEIEIREFQPDDIESFHALHNEVFPPVPLAEMRRWMARDDVTAGVAVMGGRVVGEIPLYVRQFVLRPGVTARLAFEHSVCVHEDMRGQGIGSRIQDAIKQFMRGRADVLSVYRGGERTPAYNHYDRNGLKDCCYVRTWRHDEPGEAVDESADPFAVEADEIVENAERFAARFAGAYDHAGGYQERGPGFYKTAFTQLEAVELGTRYQALIAGTGHCIIGLPDGDGDALTIMELAPGGRDLTARHRMARRLLRDACAVADEQGLSVTVELHDGGVYQSAFEGLGFEPRPRGNMIMATPLDPERLASIVWAPQRELSDVRVRVWTPQEDFVVYAPDGEPAREITLEMKHHQAVRWLMCRLDIAPLIQQELITIRGAGDWDVEALRVAIPYFMWEYQGIDHI